MKKKILITGAGGPAAVTFYRSLTNPDDYDFYMGDMDYCAAGLYFVPEDRRVILPRGDSNDFIDFVLTFCADNAIDAVIPTVDVELVHISQHEDRFHAIGVALYLCSEQTLATCHDKFALLGFCEKHQIDAGEFDLWVGQDVTTKWQLPFILKDRKGSGGRDIHLINSFQQLKQYVPDGRYMIQEWLPGAEYSVDVYTNKNGQVLAAVPRQRLKIDSGIAVTSKTVKDQKIIDYALSVAKAVPLSGAANIQVKLNANNEPRLMEINARFPGTMSITVAAGVNMPQMYLKELFGKIVDDNGDFNEIVQVRYWDEKTVSVDELAQAQKNKP
jgi:carbamoyl-phosphate synthase large subunit